MAIKKILIVDDSPTDRQFFMETLSKQGYQVVTAENGDEAITKSKSERPDLILMDVVMPGTNGFQATRAITRDEATKHIPVIVVTSKNQENLRAAANSVRIVNHHHFDAGKIRGFAHDLYPRKRPVFLGFRQFCRPS